MDLEDHFVKSTTKWLTIQATIKNMQFPELVKIPPNEETLFKKYPGNRFMRFKNLAETNPELTKKYPLLDKCFDENLLLCCAYMSHVSNITCQYIFSARNVLGNMNGVGEQNLHLDYDPKEFQDNN